MRRFHKTLVLAVLGFGLLFSATAPDLFSCHGILSLRFLPIEQARIEIAKAEVALAKKKTIRPSVQSIPEASTWAKYYLNPIFKPGPKGSWEEKSVDCFTIGYYDNRYWMWYSGTPNSLNSQVGLATSPDGVNWTRNPENPVLRLGAPGDWDNSILICNHVLFDQDRKFFEMWYVGGNSQGVLGIGYASSLDGVHWDKYAGNPVMTTTEPWEGTLIEGQTVLKMNGVYKMWYGGLALGDDISYIGYAESRDGIHWTKYSNNPILSPTGGTPRYWDGYSVDTPDVFFENGIYHMYYRGWNKRSGVSWIGHATSPDGLAWTRNAANPVLVTATIGGTWDDYQIYRARVFPGKTPPDPHKFVVDRMWYTGRTNSLKAQVGLAFRVRRADYSDPAIAAFPNGVNQDQMELNIISAAGDKVELAYFTPWMSNINLTIFNQEGRQVRTLVREPKLPGFYTAAWDVKSNGGRRLAPGLYLLELRGDNYLLTREVIIGR